MRKEVSSWQTALLAAAGAGFVGFLVAKFCRAAGLSEDLTYAFVGVAGWLGAVRTIDYLQRMIDARLEARGLPRVPRPIEQPLPEEDVKKDGEAQP